MGIEYKATYVILEDIKHKGKVIINKGQILKIDYLGVFQSQPNINNYRFDIRFEGINRFFIISDRVHLRDGIDITNLDWYTEIKLNQMQKLNNNRREKLKKIYEHC